MDPEIHYCVPPLGRLDLANVHDLIRTRSYFVLHAPRQTGKTSALLALRDLLNRDGACRCVYANLEVAQTARQDVGRGMRAILTQLALSASLTLEDDAVGGYWPETLEYSGPDAVLSAVLTRWSRSESRPLVLLLDEVDALIGDTLISLLRQLRAGYHLRPRAFPQSVVLCGVRDVRDYRIHSAAEDEVITGGSAFNIKAESFRLGDFTEGDVRTLLDQHRAETGQSFTPEAVDVVWDATRGQPWLVNALAEQARRRVPDRREEISAQDILEAREALILRRDTHLDQLTDKLQEPRVRRVIGPLLSDTDRRSVVPEDDLLYVRDLGLITRKSPVRIANPIYREVIPRTLTWTTQERMEQETSWYVTEDGGLDLEALLRAFQQYFREHSEHWMERFAYREAGPQLLLQAFLQRIVNAGGRIEREYGQGRRRVDLIVVWGRGPDPAGQQRAVIECKVVHRGLDRTIREGLEQTRATMDLSGAAEGHLIVFDRDWGRSWDEKVFCETRTDGGRPVTVWGM